MPLSGEELGGEAVGKELELNHGVFGWGGGEVGAVEQVVSDGFGGGESDVDAFRS